MGDALDEQEALRRLLSDVHAVLLDFDGPVTDLFRGISTKPIAGEIKKAVRTIWGPLDKDVKRSTDSHGILQDIRNMYDRPSPTPRGREALEQAEAIVTRHESVAARSAKPAPGIVTLVKTLREVGKRLVIVSNNAEGPVKWFLQSHGLRPQFEAVMGRDPKELRHMKPNPDCVNRAVKYLGLAPGECLLIGDQLTDLEASNEAGTRFLGYDPSTRRAARMWRLGSTRRAAKMRRLGADWVVSSHEPVIRAAEALVKP
jgi:phosphoglycolate phosphatase